MIALLEELACLIYEITKCLHNSGDRIMVLTTGQLDLHVKIIHIPTSEWYLSEDFVLATHE